jgi:hypothetical protein
MSLSCFERRALCVCVGLNSLMKILTLFYLLVLGGFFFVYLRVTLRLCNIQTLRYHFNGSNPVCRLIICTIHLRFNNSSRVTRGPQPACCTGFPVLLTFTF